MSRNYYIPGEFNVTCDRCSKKIKAHESKHEWTGFVVCAPCFEVRHPQDFVKSKTDKVSVPFTRPIPTLTFTAIPYIIYWDSGYTTKNYIEGDDLI